MKSKVEDDFSAFVRVYINDNTAVSLSTIYHFRSYVEMREFINTLSEDPSVFKIIVDYSSIETYVEVN